jgi:hypothetical protein
MKAKEELDMLSDITKVNDPYGRALGRGVAGDFDSNVMKPKNMFDTENDLNTFATLSDQFTGFAAGGTDLFPYDMKMGSTAITDPKEPQIVL